jgi:hypothetical protein
MFLGRKVKWLDQETFQQDQCWNWYYRACHHVDVFPGLDWRRTNEHTVRRSVRYLQDDEHSVRWAVRQLVKAQEYLQETITLDWDCDWPMHSNKKPKPLWYVAGLGGGGGGGGGI